MSLALIDQILDFLGQNGTYLFECVVCIDVPLSRLSRLDSIISDIKIMSPTLIGPILAQAKDTFKANDTLTKISITTGGLHWLLTAQLNAYWLTDQWASPVVTEIFLNVSLA